MDAIRFAAVLSFVLLIAPLAGLAEDNAGTVAAKIVKQAQALSKADKDHEADKLLRDAATSCEERLKQKPDDAQARFALAQLQVYLHQEDAAKVNLERALTLEPNCAAMHALKGLMHGDAEEFAAAETSYRKALQLDPQDIKLRVMLAHCLTNLKREDEAVALAREAVRLKPTDSRAAFFYAGLMANAGNKEEYDRVLKAAIEGNPRDVELRSFYAFGLHFLFKRYDVAYAQRVEIMKLAPGDISHEFNALIAATAGKMTAESKRHLNHVYELHRTGQYKDESFPRDMFVAASKTVMVQEYFEANGEPGYKYVFYVLDAAEKVELRVVLATWDELNEHYRSQGKLREGEEVFCLNSIRGKEQQHFGIYPTLPTYEQMRALAIEIIEGKRLPNAPGANAEKSTPTVH